MILSLLYHSAYFYSSFWYIYHENLGVCKIWDTFILRKVLFQGNVCLLISVSYAFALAHAGV